MSVRPDHDELAQDLGCAEPSPHAIPIAHDVFTHFADIAKRENAPSVASVINDELRRRMGVR